MTDNLQNRLSKFEVEPPQHLWGAISNELNDHVIGQRLSTKLQAFEVNPPSNNFEAIIASLNKEKENTIVPPLPGKLIDFNWRRFSVAASIIAVAGTLIFFLFYNNGTPGKQKRVITSVVNPTSPDNNKEVIPNPVIAVQSTPVKSPASVISRESFIRTAAVNSRNRSPRNVMASSLITHDHNDKIEVTAPPITDQAGNTILDRSLLVSKNSEYITVTSPNGEQTRISAKFLDYVSKFYDMKNQNDEWKKRFEAWKNIMLQDGSFTPAPGNYMDLLELKDILMHQ